MVGEIINARIGKVIIIVPESPLGAVVMFEWEAVRVTFMPHKHRPSPRLLMRPSQV